MKNRKQKFIEFCAQGIEPYRAAIEAGYSKAYAKTNSHILREKYENEIGLLKPVAKETIEKKFKYSVEESFNKLCEIQELALLPNDKGDYCNLNAATKAEELKGKMYGVYETDNKQKAPQIPIIQVATNEEKKLLDDI